MSKNLKLMVAGAVSLAGVYSYAAADASAATEWTASKDRAMWRNEKSAVLSRDTIKEAQLQLTQHGFTVSSDGIVGDETKNAIINFQSSHGLAQTGMLDDSTLAALNVTVDDATRAPASVPNTTPPDTSAPYSAPNMPTTPQKAPPSTSPNTTPPDTSAPYATPPETSVPGPHD